MTRTTLIAGGLAAATLAALAALLLVSAGSQAGTAADLPAAVELPQAPAPQELPASPATTAVPSQQRTFVSGTGTDANPCTRTSPCRNFQRAIDETLTGGEVIVLDSAGYGPVTITRGVQLISPAGVYAGITAFSGNAITVNVPVDEEVVLRGLTLNGLGGDYGVFVSSVGRLYVQHLVIKGFGTGVLTAATAPDTRLVVEDSVLHDNNIGVWCDNGIGIPRVTLDTVRVENGSWGILSYLNCRMTVRDSVATGHANHGFLTSGGGTLNIEHSEATHNGVGIHGSPSRTRVSETLVSENATGLSGTVTSFGNNSVGGNGIDGSFTSTIPES